MHLLSSSVYVFYDVNTNSDDVEESGADNGLSVQRSSIVQWVNHTTLKMPTGYACSMVCRFFSEIKELKYI